MKKYIITTAVLALLWGCMSVVGQKESSNDQYHAVVASKRAAMKVLDQDANDYSWQLFLYLNQKDGDAARWEKWKNSSEVYLPNGAKPAPYTSDQSLPAEVVKKAKELNLSGHFHDLTQFIQADGLSFKDKSGSLVRYEILLNESTFNYILKNGIYNINGQEAVAQGRGPIKEINFDWSAMEMKTSWMWLEKSDPNYSKISKLYMVKNAFYPILSDDGKITGYKVGQAAMTGMHITTKLIPQWVWITFENKHNAEFTNSKVELGIPPATQQSNQKYHAKLSNSILKEYNLIGVQTNFVDPKTNKPTLLANSQIESAFQKTSSCVTCHSLATISKSNTGNLRFPYMTTKGGNVSYYVGNPPETPGFINMDFVWSLRLATRKKD